MSSCFHSKRRPKKIYKYITVLSIYQKMFLRIGTVVRIRYRKEEQLHHKHHQNNDGRNHNRDENAE